jgi:hypothetical protein
MSEEDMTLKTVRRLSVTCAVLSWVAFGLEARQFIYRVLRTGTCRAVDVVTPVVTLVMVILGVLTVRTWERWAAAKKRTEGG